MPCEPKKTNTEAKDSRLSHNAGLWSEAYKLVLDGYELHALSPFKEDREGKYHVLFKHPETQHEVVIIDTGPGLAPALIKPMHVVEFTAVYSDAPTIGLSLSHDPQKNGPAADMYLSQPKPHPNWCLTIDGVPTYRGHNTKKLQPIQSALVDAKNSGAAFVTIHITKDVRTYFRTKNMRIEAIQKALRDTDTKLLPWTRANGLDYTLTQQVIRRGEDHENIRELLSKLVGLPESTLWPDIEWETVTSHMEVT